MSPSDTLTAARRRAAQARAHAPIVVDRARPLLARARRVLGPVSAVGWTVLAFAVLGWVVGRRLGWQEFMLIATAALVLFVACAMLAIGRTRLRVEVEVQPQRVVVGSPAAGSVQVTHTGRAPLLPIMLEVPVGADAARFALPTLRSGVTHEELFVVPTARRGVIPVGPATTVRGDPLGLVRRTVAWTGVLELFVHPRTVALDSLGAGLLRDLEGQTTNDVSTSDLAFHTLRDYVPGDDRRYIHWRSSAKAGRFLVRQFLDTRRSHFATVVDGDPASYTDPDDYETAISVAASVAVRATLDEQDVTVVAGELAVAGEAGPTVLDAFARAELGGAGLVQLCTRAAATTQDVSVALLLTGAACAYPQMQRAAMAFPPEVRTIVVKIDPSRPTGIVSIGGLIVLTLQLLTELPTALAGSLT